MSQISIPAGLEIRERLKAHLQAQGITYTGVRLRIHDEGLGLMVTAPTESHPKIPLVFEGLDVLVRLVDPV